jgi:hypothetical protein
MFHPPRATLAHAAEELGWEGDLVGPVNFGGARFWAVARVSPSSQTTERNPDVVVMGCLFTGPARLDLLRAASLLAAYSPRAVLVDERSDLTGLLVDAALLDQGVVAFGPDGLRLLARPGPRVVSGPITPREQVLLDRVHAAWVDYQVVAFP